MTRFIMALAGAWSFAARPRWQRNTTLKLVERATTDAVTDLGAKDDSAGDLLTFANEVYDEGNAKAVGSDTGWCIRTVAGKSWECFWTLSLADGQITVHGPFLDAGDSVLAVTGGTGAYSSVRGEMKLACPQSRGHRIRFCLQPDPITADRPVRRRRKVPVHFPPCGQRGGHGWLASSEIRSATMPDFHTWISFVAATEALLIIPGPTVLLVISYAWRRASAPPGRRCPVWRPEISPPWRCPCLDWARCSPPRPSCSPC
jgi:hypothetical protein